MHTTVLPKAAPGGAPKTHLSGLRRSLTLTSSPCSEPARWDTKTRPTGSQHQGSISTILCQATKALLPMETKGLDKGDLVSKLGGHVIIPSPHWAVCA